MTPYFFWTDPNGGIESQKQKQKQNQKTKSEE